MRFIDVGIFLCVAVKEPKEYYEECKKLLKRLKEGKEKVATSILTPLIFYFILENRENLPKAKLTKAMKALNMLNIEILPLKNENMLEEASIIAERYNIDFNDAFNILLMEKYEIKEIYALDKDYDKIKGIRRLIPE